ncbi:unnamed protein product [Linum tenue]|uniref:Transmembrane protein n=1 Tax=Linum tenue TaxID=586396 RepID=A0AAV0QKP6_9ROSI|nr:unnamed protein product [Linum tenue]CAI0545636.1 unnamed protein product [Linum tenue]
MEKQRLGLLFIFAIVISLAVLSFVSCVIAEIKKVKVLPTFLIEHRLVSLELPNLILLFGFWQKKDVKLQDAMCYLPESHAFGFGIAAIASLVIAHALTNLFICGNFLSSFCSSSREKPVTPPLPPSASISSSTSSSSSASKKPSIPALLLLLFSWASFGLAVVLLGGATSMSATQPFGKGWLDGKCYVVKDGIYAGSGVLTLVSTAAVLGSAVVTVRKAQAEQGRRVHAQAVVGS